MFLTMGGAKAAGPAVELKERDWSFDAPFGTFDRSALRRGYKVYSEVCAACHAMDLMKFRNLAQPGGPEFTEDEVKVIAADYTVEDGPDDYGDMFERARMPKDPFPAPFANENAARASNGGAYPVDLSLVVKARGGAEDYVYSLLTGYEDAPEGFDVPAGMNYNAYFPGHLLAMANPLSDEIVDYEDGAPMTVDQYAKDVTTFLTWASEPTREARHRLGFQVMIFLTIFAGLMYFTMRKASDELHFGELDGVQLVFLPRHGRGHVHSPSSINYRANIDVLKRVGVTDIVSVSAVGSLKEELPPGHFVIVDQFVDRTFAREKSFFGKGCVAHVSMADPVNARLGDLLGAACGAENIPHTRGGTYLAMEGPQFSSRAESELYRSWGCSVIGMTNMPEAKLAREAEICYATVAMVTDYDCWHPHEDDVDVAKVIQILTDNAERSRAMLRRLIGSIAGKDRTPCPQGHDQALEMAIITAPEGFRQSVDALVQLHVGADIDMVAGIEARGFILGGAVAHQLGKGFIPVRKKGKLPAETMGQEYELEYGTDIVEIHTDAVAKGANVLLVDDLIATGGTAEAAVKLIGRAGANVLGASFVIELPALGGRDRLEGYDIEVLSLCTFEGD
ncbi:unnamed protein product [Effrenium voratum]|nr:unnamed protein product [Effrenium voratum]